MQTNRSWSIDDKRYNFQFGCEIGWEIKNGQARAHGKESVVFGDHDRILEFAGRDLLARRVDAYGELRIAARANRSR
jgi:TldD protein